MASETQIAHLLAQPASFTPNFTAEHSVVLPYSLQAVFDKFGSGETLEDGARLSDLCSTFRLTTKDYVTLSKDQSLAEVRCRGLQASSEPHTVTISGCLTSDRERNMALYESSAAGGILIWRLRTFEELAPSEGDGQARTKVHERIQGRAPMLLRSTVEKETRRAHTIHMEQYHTLFT
ncbi:hypothetical protein B0H14DRAFT_2714535 [Mycena olivaceomarginata]|nr:hypothetical protein B0H14DRAFT_2714535 [Mycena olivaceomarginata]